MRLVITPNNLPMYKKEGFFLDDIYKYERMNSIIHGNCRDYTILLWCLTANSLIITSCVSQSFVSLS